MRTSLSYSKRCLLALATAASLGIGSAGAAISAEEAAQLGTTLTPWAVSAPAMPTAASPPGTAA